MLGKLCLAPWIWRYNNLPHASMHKFFFSYFISTLLQCITIFVWGTHIWNWYSYVQRSLPPFLGQAALPTCSLPICHQCHWHVPPFSIFLEQLCIFSLVLAKISPLKMQIFKIFVPKTPYFWRKICSLDPTFGNLCGTAPPPKKMSAPSWFVSTFCSVNISHLSKLGICGLVTITSCMCSCSLYHGSRIVNSDDVTVVV